MNKLEKDIERLRSQIEDLNKVINNSRKIHKTCRVFGEDLEKIEKHFGSFQKFIDVAVKKIKK